jgi:cell division protein FtsI (penicillin-binding protein 3)
VTQNRTTEPNRQRRDVERRHALEVGRTRLLVAGAAFGAAFLLIAARLVELTMLHEPRDSWFATPRHATAHAPARAEIVDRNGIVLATNLRTASLFANPQNVIDVEGAARRLRTVLPELDEDALAEKLDGDGEFVWLRRHLSPNQVHAINCLGIPGLEFRAEERRVYPLGPSFGHVVGFTDIDGRGIAGVEAQLDERLRTSGAAVRLSLESRVQQVVRAELADGVSRFRAIGGGAIVLDAHNGEIVAMVSLPEFDPNAPQSIDEESRFNRNTLGVYEMGSTFKVFTTAMALDRGTATMTDGYDARHPILVSRFVIRDSHAKARWLSVPEIFMYSSNIGAAKMALDVGVQGHHEFLGRLGMFVRSPVELPETGQPLVPARWREINTMTIAFGHGLSVSPLHLASGVAAMVNGGILYPPTVLVHAPGERAAGRRVVSEATSLEMRRLLRLVVERGTGKKADVAGYLVGGKTGTAEKVVDGGYRQKAMLSSFVGAFPIHDPKYVVLAMLDEPHGNAETRGEATGGWVAAPVVGRMIARMAPILGMAPIADDRDDIKQAMHVDIGRKADGVKHLASY